MISIGQQRRLMMVLLAGLLSMFASEGWSEPDRGQALYENHCRFCHEDRVHTRKDRLVTTLEGLSSWVTSWSVHAGLNWDKEEIGDVTNYLNRGFYQFTDQD